MGLLNLFRWTWLQSPNVFQLEELRWRRPATAKWSSAHSAAWSSATVIERLDWAFIQGAHRMRAYSGTGLLVPLAIALTACGGGDGPRTYEELVLAANERESRARELSADRSCNESSQCGALAFGYTRATCATHHYAPLSLVSAQAPAALEVAGEQRALAEAAYRLSPHPFPTCAPSLLNAPRPVAMCVERRCDLVIPTAAN